jgi:hypothetical protein
MKFFKKRKTPRQRGPSPLFLLVQEVEERTATIEAIERAKQDAEQQASQQEAFGYGEFGEYGEEGEYGAQAAE